MSDTLFKVEGSNTVLRFYEEAVKNNFCSEQSGKPVYDTVLLVEVITPGQAATSVVHEIERTYCAEFGLDGDKRTVRRSDKYNKYKEQVERFKAAEGTEAGDGLPINAWPQIDAGTAANLRAQGVYSVEALAEVSDAALQNLGGFGRKLREQAKAYITAREFGVPTAQQTARVNELETENARLSTELEEVKAQLAALQVAATAQTEVTLNAAPQESASVV